MYKLWIAQTRIIHDAFVIAAIRCLLRLARRQLTTARINCHDLRPTGSTELPSLSCWGASIQPPRHSIYRLHSLHSLHVIRRTNYYYLHPWLFVTTTNCHKFNDWPIYRRPERILRSRGSQIHRSYVAHEHIYCPIPILTCSLSLYYHISISSTMKAFTATWTADQQQPPCTTHMQDTVRRDCKDCRLTIRHTWATLQQRPRQALWACTDTIRDMEAPPATSRPSPTTWWAQYQRSTNVIKTPFTGMYQRQRADDDKSIRVGGCCCKL